MAAIIGGNPTPTNGTKNLIHSGRPLGAQGRHTRVLRHALLLAAEESRHSKDGSLKSYCIFLADEHPDLFVSLLGRLLPVQAKVALQTGQPNPNLMNMNMPLEEMVSTFAERIHSVYMPPTIEHDPDNAFNEEEKPE